MEYYLTEVKYIFGGVKSSILNVGGVMQGMDVDVDVGKMKGVAEDTAKGVVRFQEKC